MRVVEDLLLLWFPSWVILSVDRTELRLRCLRHWLALLLRSAPLLWIRLWGSWSGWGSPQYLNSGIDARAFSFKFPNYLI
jgi:hypothetical protein